MADVCQVLHELMNQCEVFAYPFDATRIPRNGIYVLFEKGELAHGTNRIVRIGTHNGNNQLRDRLKQHLVAENKDRSIFRKNIGRCLLNKTEDPFLVWWDIDRTSSQAKAKHAGQIDLERQAAIERQVTEYMRTHFSFVVFEVAGKDDRLKLESKLISTVAQCRLCGPSSSWLGLHSPKEIIRTYGLWQVNELNKRPLSIDELDELGVLIGKLG